MFSGSIERDQCQEMSESISSLSWWRSLSYRNQSTDLPSNFNGWFLHDRDLRHERVHVFLQSFKNCRREHNGALMIYF